jgi:hypothetical protein|tara:strand:- start:557 stop:754 length:198 start_codon:yes stop_codon:yes gene_type:complete
MGMFDNVKKDLIEDLFGEDLQKEIVDALNKNIDIPFLSEKTEEKAFNALYDTVEGVIKAAILKKF